MELFTDPELIGSLSDYDSVVHGAERPTLRRAEAQNVILPLGTVVVSADNHWSCAEDIFYRDFPAHLKHRAPRWIGEGPGGHWEIDGRLVVPAALADSVVEFEMVPGTCSMAPRLVDLDAEGIDKEIVFPNGIAGFYGYPDVEVREWIFRTHNRYLAGLQSQAPGRFYGVAVPTFWDMSKIRESIAEIKALGMKTVLLPQYPKGANGVELDYCSIEMDPLFAAIEESGLPIVFHVGEFAKLGPGGLAIGAMVGFGPFRKSLGELIFGGIFDRHPALQVVFTEADINWVPGALQTAAMIYESYQPFLDPKIRHHPRHYWQNNCYTTFVYDPLGMRMLDIVGADRCLWSCDYVHMESNFGYGWSAKKIIVDTVSADDARAMLGGTAMRVFGL